jgi:hypothetical protein
MVEIGIECLLSKSRAANGTEGLRVRDTDNAVWIKELSYEFDRN